MTPSPASPDGPATDGPRERPVPEAADAFCGGARCLGTPAAPARQIGATPNALPIGDKLAERAG
jgi:hypothetical protein